MDIPGPRSQEQAADFLRRHGHRLDRGGLSPFPRKGPHRLRLGHQPDQRLRRLLAGRHARSRPDLTGLQGRQRQWPPGGEALRQPEQGDRRPGRDRKVSAGVRRGGPKGESGEGLAAGFCAPLLTPHGGHWRGADFKQFTPAGVPVRLGINLRGDLAKLSDEGLATHLEKSLAYREWLSSRAADAPNRWLYKIGVGMPFGRGPLHARIFYRAMGLIYGGPLNGHSLGDLYVLDCEIKDIMDELRRRARIARRHRLSP
ncbi:conserved hypothetical protein [Bosea sp. 62]|nr:conserved hypothetical protein [Bosea sp. 21B]CAD5263002.1 conserved hypothetical protein [Bosea sp. 7B]CAD5271660.1 conserved hypothetical protein [Bosea sp. 46]VVT43849.1 conserved hypothetical protein [Bosea sp. EC-HK365B]VXB18299.1 conserved hypothetical protein [Bosea sp. 29B]VXB73991.1 conserved hypothetical protein [Bosea sp. 62]VXC37248.1 conserved hypothetical protein [Bosea sp. 127]VXC54221.1 conserved hypothetical protein [Bosea sp. 125]